MRSLHSLLSCTSFSVLCTPFDQLCTGYVFHSSPFAFPAFSTRSLFLFFPLYQPPLFSRTVATRDTCTARILLSLSLFFPLQVTLVVLVVAVVAPSS